MTRQMGVLGAFVFAAQMLDFAIPGTGSSGHLGGGLLLAVRVGPEAALIVIASILSVQALFFADGGLLALGCNIFNMGVLPAFVALPLFRRVVGNRQARPRILAGCVVAAQAALLLGAGSVVLETTLSGISSLPLPVFAAAMLPIHAAIGLVEGLVTASALLFVQRAHPELLMGSHAPRSSSRRLVWLLATAAAMMAGALCWFASTKPDGLEWSMERVDHTGELERRAVDAVHGAAASLQRTTSVLPDYGFKDDRAAASGRGWGKPDAGASISGVVGGLTTLLLVGLVGFALSRRRGRADVGAEPNSGVRPHRTG